MKHDEASTLAFERPDPALMQYYVYCALLTLLGAPFVIVPLWFRYITLRYKIEEDGISMRWGVLFRREVYLTYRRIQDIHVTRNLLERWMGLAKISLQTAAGSSQAELVIEGNKTPEAMRDFLYRRMRGARDEVQDSHMPDDSAAPVAAVDGVSGTPTDSQQKVLAVLTDIRDSLKVLASKRSPER